MIIRFGFYGLLSIICIQRVLSLCAFPCMRRGRVYQSFDGNIMWNFSRTDPSIMTGTAGGKTFEITCVERAGPFYYLKRFINGRYEYLCIKDTVFDRTDDSIRILYSTKYEYYPIQPTLCEICNGKGLAVIGNIDINRRGCRIALGCNIPWTCPVTDPSTQIQCSPCEDYETDDGLCCQPMGHY